MSQMINLNGLSREELLDLAGRIEERPQALSEDTSSRTAETADDRCASTIDAADPGLLLTAPPQREILKLGQRSVRRFKS